MTALFALFKERRMSSLCVWMAKVKDYRPEPNTRPDLWARVASVRHSCGPQHVTALSCFRKRPKTPTVFLLHWRNFPDGSTLGSGMSLLGWVTFLILWKALSQPMQWKHATTLPATCGRREKRNHGYNQTGCGSKTELTGNTKVSSQGANRTLSSKFL